MNISIAIMAHPARKKYAQRLYNALIKMQFQSVSLVYDSNDNEWLNGVEALRSHTDSDWHIVIQDDAIISPDFYRSAANAIEHVPLETLISFYTGTVRPFPSMIRSAVNAAVATNASWLKGKTLFWGVCIAIPTKQIQQVLEYVSRYNLKYDTRIGWYYRRYCIPVYYTWPSIVDHNYRINSLIGNDYNNEPRKAHKFVSQAVEFSKTEVVIGQPIKL